MKTTSALITALADAGTIDGNPDAPLLTPNAVKDIIESVLGDVPVVAVKTLTGAGAAKVLAETVAAGATDADYVVADLGKMTSVTRVEAIDITTHDIYLYVPGVGAAKAVKIAADGAQTLLANNGITVSGAVVTLGSSVLTNAASFVVTITGK